MARFRIFRRLSSHHTADDASSDSKSLHSPLSSPTSIPGPPLRISTSGVAATTNPRLQRKTRSLTKLRKRFAAAPDKQLTEPPREFAFSSADIVPTDTVVEQEKSLRSRGELLPAAEEEPAGFPLDLDGRPPAASADNLRIKTDAYCEKAPELVVHQPTPVEIDGAVGSGGPPERPISGEITLAATSDGYSASDGSARDNLSELVGIEADQIATQQAPSEQPGYFNAPPKARRPSIVDSGNAQIVDALIDPPLRPSTAIEHTSARLPEISAMLHRKIWVKRPGASPTMVQIREDDLVDDVRDIVLRKYGNSLGKTFDSPDMTLNIVTRQGNGGPPREERGLGPEEHLCRTLDSFYPGGQTVEEALVINVPQKRATPRPSPKAYHPQSYHAMDEYRPLENGTDYFPPVGTFFPPTIPQTTSSHDSRSGHSHHPATVAVEHPPRSIAVLNTGQLPPLPSPGAQARRHGHRPKFQRQPTSSPTIMGHASAANVSAAIANTEPALVHRHTTRPRMGSTASDGHHNNNNVPAPPPLPTPPAPEAPPTNMNNSTPPPLAPTLAATTPHPHRLSRPKKARKSTPDKTTKSRHQLNDSTTSASLTNSVLDGSVPPINVLIVEDNIINLRILESLMKRLKVRWQTAMNGQIAVDKWRLGGFHLVLMDIQMPVMSGLQATKEIRRLERINGIGVFSSSAPNTPDEEETPSASMNGVIASEDQSEPSSATSSTPPRIPSDDILTGNEGLFKSPVIIVALTASSLQSDRHEALAAGCNDFLTKPVNFVWLERKVKEWGCMQALIDFDGWRKWKEFAAKEEAGKSAEEKRKESEKAEKEKVKMEKMAKLQALREKKDREEKEKKRVEAEAAATVTAAPAAPVADGAVVNGEASSAAETPA